MFDQLFFLDLVNIDTNWPLYGNDNLLLHKNKAFVASVHLYIISLYIISL